MFAFQIPREFIGNRRGAFRSFYVQLQQALRKLGRQPRVVEGFISKPHESIEKLGPIEDPMIGVCVRWIYGPHTAEGVVSEDNPLLLASAPDLIRS